MDRSSAQMGQQDGTLSESPTPQSSLYDKDLLRMFAEVNFIQGEVTYTFFFMAKGKIPIIL